MRSAWTRWCIAGLIATASKQGVPAKAAGLAAETATIVVTLGHERRSANVRAFRAAFFGGFAGKVAATLFVAICAFFGFGPEEWVRELMPSDISSAGVALARTIFLGLGAMLILLWGYWFVITYRFVWPIKPRGRQEISQEKPSIESATKAFQEDLKHRAAVNRLALTGQIAQPVEPQPIFGCPRQLASELYRSWWHVPITVSESPGDHQNKIENATVELVWEASAGIPVRMQWQSADSPDGVNETTLLEGRNRLVPVVLRDEPRAPNRIGPCVTGFAFLIQKNNKHPIPHGGHPRLLRLLVRSGKRVWSSPHRYVLRVPPENETNGHFTLEIWHEGKD